VPRAAAGSTADERITTVYLIETPLAAEVRSVTLLANA